MEDWRNHHECRTNSVSVVKMNPTKVEKDKFGVKLKYPERSCKNCKKYPCFEGIGNCASDFAKYGCTLYSINKNETI